MPTKHLLEELDQETRDYLLAVRDGAGKGMPGAYAPVVNTYPALGCIFGLIVLVLTPILTLTTATQIIYDDPARVAMLQTAGFVLGGWMLVAAFRSWLGKKRPGTAGHWVYADAANLYEAAGEQVTVTPLDDLQGAKVRHNYNQKKYSNSVLRVFFTGNKVRSITLTNEEPAEELTTFLNYIEYAFGPDGGERAKMPLPQLGALAKRVARTNEEPRDAEGALDPGQISIGWDGPVPEAPERARRATPRVLPYILILIAGVGCYLLMSVVNVPIRDDAIFEAVTTTPVEPRYLRSYLIDARNTRHRDEVVRRLEPFYTPAIAAIQNANGGLPGPGKTGMIEVLKSVAKAEQPIVSIRVAEAKSAPGSEGGAAARAKGARLAIATRMNNALDAISPKIIIPMGMEITPPPPPIGEQLLVFVEAPEDAANPHFDVRYSFEPGAKGRFRVTCQVVVRVDVDGPATATADMTLPVEYAATDLDRVSAELAPVVVRALTGTDGAINPPLGPGFGGALFVPPEPD